MESDKGSDYMVEFVPWDSPGAETLKSIRFRVFVDEQQVPEELELDEFDSEAVHVLAKNGGGTPCGTGRMFTDVDDEGKQDNPSHTRVKIGRMAVLKEIRGSGCGAAILSALVDEARHRGYNEAILSAQTHAVAFYRKHGFETFGDIYDDAGIPHQMMRLGLSKVDGSR